MTWSQRRNGHSRDMCLFLHLLFLMRQRWSQVTPEMKKITSKRLSGRKASYRSCKWWGRLGASPCSHHPNQQVPLERQQQCKELGRFGASWSLWAAGWGDAQPWSPVQAWRAAGRWWRLAVVQAAGTAGSLPWWLVARLPLPPVAAPDLNPAQWSKLNQQQGKILLPEQAGDKVRGNRTACWHQLTSSSGHQQTKTLWGQQGVKTQFLPISLGR